MRNNTLATNYDNWQPIETVPRDGKVILLFRSGDYIKTVYPAIWKPHLDPAYPWMVLCDRYGDNFLPDDESLTHWQYLPTPPEEDKE